MGLSAAATSARRGTVGLGRVWGRCERRDTPSRARAHLLRAAHQQVRQAVAMQLHHRSSVPLCLKRAVSELEHEVALEEVPSSCLGRRLLLQRCSRRPLRLSCTLKAGQFSARRSALRFACSCDLLLDARPTNQSLMEHPTGRSCAFTRRILRMPGESHAPWSWCVPCSFCNNLVHAQRTLASHVLCLALWGVGCEV